MWNVKQINYTIGDKMKDQKGVAALEFALILPLLVLLAFGIIEFSVLLYDKAVITNASREGARKGIVYAYPDRIADGEIMDTVNNYCSDYLISLGGTSTINTDISRSGDSSGDPLIVRVSYRYNFLVLPNFISELASGINLVAETVMRME